MTCDRVVPKDDKTQTTCGKPAVWKHPNYPLYYCKDHGWAIPEIRHCWIGRERS